MLSFVFLEIFLFASCCSIFILKDLSKEGGEYFWLGKRGVLFFLIQITPCCYIYL